MKIRDIKESKQINEIDLSTVQSGMNSLISKATGNGDPGSENKMAMDLFLKKFINSASASVNQAVNSGLVAKGEGTSFSGQAPNSDNSATNSATTAANATANQPAASAGNSAPAAATASTPAQAQSVPQSPEEIRKQKQAAAGAVVQKQMAANPVQAKATPAVAQSPEQIRQQKQAVATKAVQGQMAPVSKLPANQPAVQASNIRQQKQAAATAAIQGQEAPFSKVTSAPVAQRAPATKQPPGFNAQNVMNLPGMQKAAVKKDPAKAPAMAENTKFDKLNNLFESIMYEEENKQSISQYIVGFYKKFMQGKNMDQAALQASLPQVIALSKEAEASYPKMNGPLTKLAQLGWAVSNQAGETPQGPTSNTSDQTGQASSQQQVQTVYTQVKGMLDKLDKKGKQRILAALEKQLGSAPAAKPAAAPTVKQTPAKATNEPMSIGGQKINPTDPLYAKMQKQMAGK